MKDTRSISESFKLRGSNYKSKGDMQHVLSEMWKRIAAWRGILSQLRHSNWGVGPAKNTYFKQKQYWTFDGGCYREEFSVLFDRIPED